jgi:protein TonB
MRRAIILVLAGCTLIDAGAVAAHGPQTEPQQATEKPARTTPNRIRLGGQVEAAKLTHKVQPKYPKEAKKKGIGGTVRLEAIIGKDGRIADLKVISRDPLLALAATDAVRKWRYKPTLLQGQPVEVVTEIDINFLH